MWIWGTSGKGLGWSGLAAMLCDSWGILCHVGRDFSELLLPLEATWASWLYRFHFAEGAARNRCEGVNFCPNFWDPTPQMWIVRPVDARRAVCEMSWRYAHGLRVHLWCLSVESWNSWRPRGSRSHMMKLGCQTTVKRQAARIVLRLDHRFEAYGQARLRIVLEPWLSPLWRTQAGTSLCRVNVPPRA